MKWRIKKIIRNEKRKRKKKIIPRKNGDVVRMREIKENEIGLWIMARKIKGK